MSTNTRKVKKKKKNAIIYTDNESKISHCAPHVMLLKHDEWMLECYGGTLFFWGICIVSFVFYMVELYLLRFKVKKEADWSHRSKPVICVHTNVVFSPRNPDNRFITLEEREPEKTVLILSFTYRNSHIKAIEIKEYVRISISQHVDWQGKGL